MSYELHLNEREIALDILGRKPALRVKIGEAIHTILESSTADAGAFDVTVDGVPYRGWRYLAGDHAYVRLGGQTFSVGIGHLQPKAGAHGKQDDEIRADMPGTMIAVHGEAGQAVKAGDKLVTMESMKLQLTLVAPRDGIIEKFHVPAESAFERGALLVSLVPETVADDAPSKA
jgi:acetyl/propionyl-CoA carboxylase alpha subunit